MTVGQYISRIPNRPLYHWQIEQAREDAAADAAFDAEVDQARDDWDRERGLLKDDEEA